MTIPPKSDSRWKKLVTDTSELNLTGLATKMMVNRVRMIAKLNPQRLDEAVDSAHDFFVKNEQMIQDDIKVIFG